MRFPRATYRLQFHAGFTFADAERLVPYLGELGVSHVYASPLLKARPGSPHGYDIVDHTNLNPEIGTESELRGFVAALKSRGMGLIMDYVPNHMGVNHSDNAWWLDVLEWGRGSLYADFFDIDWEPSESSLRGKLLLPVLGDQYGETLHGGHLLLSFQEEAGSFSVEYYDHRFPVSPQSYRGILAEASRLFTDTSEDLGPLADGFGRLRATGKRPRHVGEVRARSDELKARLASLCRDSKRCREAVDGAVRSFNGRPGEPASFNSLHRLLEAQSYRPSYWRLAANEINYRRFFDINDLAGIRMESKGVFDLTHELVLRLLRDGILDGLRLDHVDGLKDPKAYLSSLQDAAAYRRGGGETEGDSGAYVAGLPLYVVVEKILAPHEQLREEWPVHGTTGYDAMGLIGEVLTDPSGEEALTRLYDDSLGVATSYEDVVVDAKYRVMVDSLASELNVLANQFNRLAKEDRRTRDYSRLGIRRALADVIAHFPVYRTYVDGGGAGESDIRDIDWAVGKASKLSTMADRSVYDFLRSVLVVSKEYRGTRRKKVIDLAQRTQQLTAPVTAKAEEDTAYYRYVRFVPRCEVGSQPDRFYRSIQAFHLENRRRSVKWPFSMVSTATHDHKRGEDVRARLNVLSEQPGLWRNAVENLSEITRLARGVAEWTSPVSPKDAYLIYQTIVGCWPPDLESNDSEGFALLRKRVEAYAVKAAREAKQETTWTAPNGEYEAALSAFVEGLLSPEKGEVALRRIEEVVRSIEAAGAVNSLSQTLLKLTMPGVPDIYQGREGWDFSLVDPDNRRSVDFDGLAACLGDIRQGNPSISQLVDSWRNGRIKQHVVYRALQTRKALPGVYASGDYLPLETAGTYADAVIAFAQENDEGVAVTVVPRLVSRLVKGLPLPDGWGNTAVVLPKGVPQWECRMTDSVFPGRVGGTPVAEILATFPVSLLVAGPR